MIDFCMSYFRSVIDFIQFDWFSILFMSFIGLFVIKLIQYILFKCFGFCD